MPKRDDKPKAAKLGWEIRESTYLTPTNRMRLRQDRLFIPGTGEVMYSYEERAPAVGIVPVTADGIILLIWQYRYPLDTWCLEIPAGGTADQPGLSSDEVARIELREEVGATCKEMEYVASFYPKASSINQQFHVFLAWGAECVMEPAREPTEQIELRPMLARDALHLARTGQMPEGISALALLLCETRLRERGILTHN